MRMSLPLRQRIGFIALPGFQLMSAGVLAVFELANMEMGEPVYDVHLLSETGRSIRGSIGISGATESLDDTNFDTVITGGIAAAGAFELCLIEILQPALQRFQSID